MSVNEITVTLKGDKQDPWIVIHAENTFVLDQALDSITGDLLAKIHSTDAIFGAAKNVVPIAPAPVAAQATPAPQVVEAVQPVTAAPVAVVPQPAVVAPTPPPAPVSGVGSDLPEGTRMWTAPDAKKPEYQATYFTFPWINDAGSREAFTATMKKNTWCKWDASQKAWYAPTKNAEYIEGQLIANAALFV